MDRASVVHPLKQLFAEMRTGRLGLLLECLVRVFQRLLMRSADHLACYMLELIETRLKNKDKVERSAD